VRLAVVLALLAVRRALALVADAERLVALRLRVAAAFWPLVVLEVSAMSICALFLRDQHGSWFASNQSNTCL
jgi:hypothetical protein